jgi:predicted ATPase
VLTKVTLTRFRGFKSLEAELRPVSVILGPNSSGKTSVLHAVRVAIEALSMGLEQENPHLESDGRITVHDGIVWDHARLFPTADWAELFTNKQVGKGIEMKVSLTFEESDVIQDLEVVLTYARNQQLRMRIYVASTEAMIAVSGYPLKSKFRSDALLRQLLDGAPKGVLIPAFYGVTGQEDYRTTPHVERMLGGGDQSRVVRNLVARLRPEAFSRLNEFLRRHLGASLTSRSSNQDVERILNLEVNFRDTNGSLELASAGAGLVNLISLYSAMELFRPANTELGAPPVIYLLDEPEAHLHPRLQGNVGEAIGALASEFGAQILIATHSVEMINRLGQRRDAILLSVDRANSRIARLESEDALVQELSRWCDLTPFTSINFLASRRVFFHEGPSDVEFIKRCADIYFRGRPVDLARFRQWTPVPLGGTGKVSAQAVLGVVLQPNVFPTVGSGPPVRAICVLDRDAERTPGFHQRQELSKGAYEAHELVWSRYSIESLFLDPACLTEWLLAVLPPGAVPEPELRALVEAALAQADKDLELVMDAARRLSLAKMKGKGEKVSDAMKESQQKVIQQPAVWQHGRDRAGYVLGKVRAGLPDNATRNHVRTNLLNLISAAAVDKLGDIRVLIPAELQSLLDYMASAPPGASAAEG